MRAFMHVHACEGVLMYNFYCFFICCGGGGIRVVIMVPVGMGCSCSCRRPTVVVLWSRPFCRYVCFCDGASRGEGAVCFWKLAHGVANSVYLRMFVCVCMYVCMDACMCVCVYVCMYVCMYVLVLL